MSVSGEQTAPLPTLLQVLRQGTLGEYEILREIGQGGMATVFLAHEIALDRKVAIKVMSPQFVHGADMIERFKREARTAAGLNHPHIIPIYAVRESQQLLFFVMKYIGGRSLEAILRDVGALPFPMVRSILSDIGSALDYAHRQGVVHRDVKPGNIMIDEEGFAVITDFGIARAVQSDSLTRSGTTVGTPSYLSPEACSGEAVGSAADQYSLGIVGYEMITGQLPFRADSSLGMMYAQVHSPPRPSEQLRPDCPADLRSAIMRMLEKAPEDRFGSLKEAGQQLSGLRTGGRGESKDGDDSGVRTHIGLLAVPRPGRPVGEMRTPNSPAPLSRVPPNSRVLARQRQVKLSRVLVGLLLAAVGAGATFLTIRARQEAQHESDSAPAPVLPAAPPPDTRADSTLLVARGAAEYARERAVTSGATAAALAQGDSLRAAAQSVAVLGQKGDAALLLTRATGIYGNAERTAQPQPAPTTPGSPPRPSPPVTTKPTGVAPSGAVPAPTAAEPNQPVSDSIAVLRFYVELQRAISARQLGEVRRLVQNLSEPDERELRSLFEDDDIASIQAVYTVQTVSRREEVVFARVREELTVVDRRGKVSKKRNDILLARLTLGPQGWRQIRSEKVRK